MEDVRLSADSGATVQCIRGKQRGTKLQSERETDSDEPYEKLFITLKVLFLPVGLTVPGKHPNHKDTCHLII